jgi:hypothetical protein
MKNNSSNSSAVRVLAEADLIRALEELANLRDEVAAFERFCTRWPELAYFPAEMPDPHPVEETALPAKFWLIYERRQKLRDIWEGELLPLRQFLLPSDPPEEVRAEYIDRASSEIQVGFLWDAPFTLDWTRSEIIYKPKTEFQRAIYALFRKSALVKKCENPECPAPYFVARKANRRYCSENCAEVFQREAKRNWWAEHGEEWRQSRRKPRRRASRKR